MIFWLAIGSSYSICSQTIGDLLAVESCAKILDPESPNLDNSCSSDHSRVPCTFLFLTLIGMMEPK